MNNPKQIFTQEGYDKIVSEIEERETTTRTKIADEIEKARQQGDLSENAAYKASIEAKEFNENRINQLRELLANAEVSSNSFSGVVDLGRKVTIQKVDGGGDIEYIIVGHNEANPTERKISLDSPLGKSLSGKKKGDKVTVNTPGGSVEFVIKNIK